MTQKARVFLDTSALFAGIWSGAGGARMILKLGEAEAIQIWVGPQVLKEAEAVVRRKAPAALPDLALLLDRSGVQVGPPAKRAILRRSRALINHPGDAHVLAEAWTAGVGFFVTLDREHFLENQPMRAEAPFQLGTPGDFLAWFCNSLL